MPVKVNIAARLRRNAERTPDKPAVIICRGPGKAGSLETKSHTFAELERLSDAAARGFAGMGIGRGVKTLVMLRPSLPFFAAFYALFKIGAVPVLIDPGMGRRRLLECVRSTAPEAMVGVPAAHLARVLFPRYFPGCRRNVTVGRRWLWGGETWRRMLRFSDQPFQLAETDADELAAILFTTGSTGPAKGVEYGHGALDSQVRILSDVFAIAPEDRDMATFPGFSLFSVALGMTAVVPDMNPVRPGGVYPPNVLEPANRMDCTFSFGSPALWRRVAEYAGGRGIRLSTVKRIVMAGAPVPAAVHKRLLEDVLPPGSETYTPYGATEVMPVACISGSEALAETAARTEAGDGVCVGLPAAGARVEIIAIGDAPIPEWSDSLRIAPGGIGEIAVQAEHASKRYHNLPAADALAKIADGTKFWHRMGDVGWKDGLGRIWFCGRKAHRVVTANGVLFTICCEAIFNRHPEIARSALVGVPDGGGWQKPVIVVEPRRGLNAGERETVGKELIAMAAEHDKTSSITTILFHPAFPTDIRHNAKIRREDLAVWAERKLAARA